MADRCLNDLMADCISMADRGFKWLIVFQWLIVVLNG